jgi:hypothetical protein
MAVGGGFMAYVPDWEQLAEALTGTYADVVALNYPRPLKLFTLSQQFARRLRQCLLTANQHYRHDHYETHSHQQLRPTLFVAYHYRNSGVSTCKGRYPISCRTDYRSCVSFELRKYMEVSRPIRLSSERKSW